MKEILLFCSMFIGFTRVNAQFSLWSNLPLDFNDKPWVMIYDSISDKSYISGSFSLVGGSACNVVEWDGNNYTLLPSSSLSYTNCMAIYNGKLYIGGDGFACWNGYSWTTFEDTTTIGVDCMIIYQNKLLVSRYFMDSNGYLRCSVATWNDTTWTDMYRVDTLFGTEGWSVKALAYYKDELYIAGNINPSNHPEINEIARFDGTNWKDVGEFSSGYLADIRRLLVWKDTLYACGSFTEIDGAPGNGIAKWDGTQWHRLNNGLWQEGGPAVTDMKIFKSELYATGWFYVVDNIDQGIGFKGFAKWNGSRWCTLGAVADNVLFTMGNFRDSLYVMGGFDSLNNEPMQHMAKWIGGDYTDSCSSGGVGINELIHENNATAFLLYPDPASTQVTMKLETKKAGTITATIRDILGRNVLIKDYAHHVMGKQMLKLNVSGLIPGLYWITLQADERQYNGRLMIHRE